MAVLLFWANFQMETTYVFFCIGKALRGFSSNLRISAACGGRNSHTRGPSSPSPSNLLTIVAFGQSEWCGNVSHSWEIHSQKRKLLAIKRDI